MSKERWLRTALVIFGFVGFIIACVSFGCYVILDLKSVLEQLKLFKNSYRNIDKIIVICTIGLFIYYLVMFFFIKMSFCCGKDICKTLSSLIKSMGYALICSLIEMCVLLLATVSLATHLGRLVTEAHLSEHSMEFVGNLLLGIVLVTVLSDLAFGFVLIPVNWFLGLNRKRDYLWHNARLFSGRCFMIGAIFTFFSVHYALNPIDVKADGYSYAATLICAAVVFLGNPIMEGIIRVIKISYTNFRLSLAERLNRLISRKKSKMDDRVKWKERYRDIELKTRRRRLETMKTGFLSSLGIEPDALEYIENI